MKKLLNLKKINRPTELMVLDTEQGVFSTQTEECNVTNGSYLNVGGHEFAIFAADQNLFFQWEKMRWNFKELKHSIRYAHDFQRKVTIFSVDGKRLEYPAWWVGDITFDPNIPERDEDEDILAYVANLAKNEELQTVLIKKWDK